MGEARFHLSGYINSQNYRSWNTDTPHVLLETALHSVKIGVCMAMSSCKIVRPIFFNVNVHQPFLEQLHDNEVYHGYFHQLTVTVLYGAQDCELFKDYFEIVLQDCLSYLNSRDTIPDEFEYYVKNNNFFS